MPSRPSAPRIFISYARRDGKQLAHTIRRRLSDEHGFSLWQDLPDMEGGKDWWRQITEAIEHVEYLVLVMTEAAVRSPVVRDEWRYARQHGVCVLPVLGAPDLDFSQLTGWMRRAHFVDPNVPEQWTRFVRTLEGPCTAARVPMMAEAPPEHFVARPEEFEALRSQLLDASRGEPVAVTAALRGAGGYGKTTLARALCQDDAIQEAFSDGILWVTLGEQPGISAPSSRISSSRCRASPLACLRSKHAKAGSANYWPTGACCSLLTTCGAPQDLKPFLGGGTRCARLITTRNSETLPR